VKRILIEAQIAEVPDLVRMAGLARRNA